MMNPDLLRFAAQRISGAVLSLLLLIHLAGIIYAVRGGLSVAEITARLQDSAFWLPMYALMIVAAVIHASIGIRNILAEMQKISAAVRKAIVAAYLIGTSMLGIWTLNTVAALS